MRIKNLFDSLNAQQRSVPQLPAMAKAKHISVLGAKTDPEHPFAGYMVGAGESAEPSNKRLGPDPKDPYEQGWRSQPDAANPYPAGTSDHAKWQDGRDERAAQPHHYDEGVVEGQLDEKCWDGYKKQGMKTMFGKRVPNCVKNEAEERNELDDPRVQAALKKMAERHKDEKWSKEQLAALGKRIAARGQGKDVKETSFAQAGEVLGGVLGGVGGMTLAKGKKAGYVAGTAAGSAVGNAAGRWIDKKLEPKIGKDEVGATKAVARYQKPAVAEDGVDEGWKSKLAGAALAGAAALGGGGAGATSVDDPSWSTAGYDSHIKADSSVTTKSTAQSGSSPTVAKDFQRRISDVTGPNSQGQYRVTVSQNGKIVSSYVTKTPPQNWMVKEDVTKEDVISKLKAKLGDYLGDLSKEIKSDPDLIDKLAAKAPGDQMGPPVKTVTTDDGHQIQIHGNEDDGFRISIKNKPAATRFKNLDEAVMACEMYCARRRVQAESADYVEEAGKDACYHKVKSRYKIWPSAYASGALVRCRKVGADNWGNKSKK